jgi:hypothetical protein
MKPEHESPPWWAFVSVCAALLLLILMTSRLLP